MIDWLAQAPSLIAALLVLFGPGALCGAIVGLRGLALWAAAPPLSVALLTCSALVLDVVRIGWTPIAALLSTIVLAVAFFAVVRLLRLGSVSREDSRHDRVFVVAGIAVGAILVACRLGFYIGEPGAISQTNDAAFHLSALRFAVETGLASPLSLSAVIGADSFYPSAWHVVAALVAQLVGSSVEVAANTTSIVLAAGAWPLGVAFLTRSVAGPRAGAFAAALSASVAAFPLLLVQWGILYPQLLAVAVLPAAIALVSDSRALSGGSGPKAARWTRTVALAAGGAVAVVMAQPSVLLAWIVAVGSYAVWLVVAGWSSWPRRRRTWTLMGVVAAAVAAAGVWIAFSRSVNVTWPPTTGEATAVLEILANGFLGYPWAVGTSVLMVIGLVAAVRRPGARWLATTWVAYAALYIVVAAIGQPMIRGLLVGAWYEDPYRLAALVPVAAIPLAGVGAAALVAWAARTLASRRSSDAAASDSAEHRAGAIALAVIGIVGVASLVVAPQIARRDVFVHRVDPNLYTVSADSFLSEDELTLLRRLDETLPPDAVVIGNPGTGMSFGYAVSGRNVIPRTWAPPSGPAYVTLWTSLRDVASDPEVCPALDAFGARYVLDFGPGEEYPGRWIMAGFTGIDGQPGFELADREGDAALWRVTACD